MQTRIGKPSEIINNIGVKLALQARGFTEENAKGVVAKILLNGKDENKLRSAEMIFKVFGSYAAEKHAMVVATVVDDMDDTALLSLISDNGKVENTVSIHEQTATP